MRLSVALALVTIKAETRIVIAASRDDAREAPRNQGLLRKLIPLTNDGLLLLLRRLREQPQHPPYFDTLATTSRAISGLSRQTPSVRMTKSAGSKTCALTKSNTARSIRGRSGSIRSNTKAGAFFAVGLQLVPGVMGSKPSATSAICPGFGRCYQMQLTGCKNARTVLLALTS